LTATNAAAKKSRPADDVGAGLVGHHGGYATIAAAEPFDRDDDGFDNRPTTANTDQFNLDGDVFVLGEACDRDADGDGVLNTIDGCPGAANDESRAVQQAGDDECEIDADIDHTLSRFDAVPVDPRP
jgi:Thrombospondin type 3 repeat